jgi:hypothetical protein
MGDANQTDGRTREGPECRSKEKSEEVSRYSKRTRESEARSGATCEKGTLARVYKPEVSEPQHQLLWAVGAVIIPAGGASSEGPLSMEQVGRRQTEASKVVGGA